ncbi:MAG: D-lyxose/D-mannose family sugar isomerase [Clostridia bacterium]|nr:D-lyxose/D-mannose family sugar isomerase [Clostridia bacterium]
MFDEFFEARREAAVMIRAAGIYVGGDEEDRITVTDFELGDLRKEGAQILEWLNTKRVCVRLIALFPFQTLPEHHHRRTKSDPGKEETLRVVSGTVLVYVPGEDTMVYGSVPRFQEEHYTVRHEIVLNPGDQYTLAPGTVHWFQAGGDGAVMYTFCSAARDANNIFTNPATVKGCRINDLG